MESDSKKRQLWFNETIKNNHIILKYSFLLFNKKNCFLAMLMFDHELIPVPFKIKS